MSSLELDFRPVLELQPCLVFLYPKLGSMDIVKGWVSKTFGKSKEVRTKELAQALQEQRLRDFYDILDQTHSGSRVYQFPYEQWKKDRTLLKSYIDLADYVTKREDYRSKGLLMKPDLTEGRCLTAEIVEETKISVAEKSRHRKDLIAVPLMYDCGKNVALLNSDRRPLTPSDSTGADGAGVIAVRDNLAVVQILNRQEFYYPELYFIDINERTCLGKFSDKIMELLWFESYISPDKTRVVVRPDVYTFSHMHNGPQAVRRNKPSTTKKQYDKLEVIFLLKFPQYGVHVLCFDNRFPNRYIFCGKDKKIYWYDLDNEKFEKQTEDLDLIAPVRQIKSSPSGDLLVIRCVYPIYSMHYQRNGIHVLSAATMQILFTVDLKGPYCESTEVINLQVFPRFSACESLISVMVNTSPTRQKIQMYKLPFQYSSLQNMCRKLIRRYVLPSELEQLPLPQKIIKYLHYDQGVFI